MCVHTHICGDVYECLWMDGMEVGHWLSSGVITLELLTLISETWSLPGIMGSLYLSVRNSRRHGSLSL